MKAEQKQRSADQLATQMAEVIEDETPQLMLMATLTLLYRIVRADTEGQLLPHLHMLMQVLNDDKKDAGHA